MTVVSPGMGVLPTSPTSSGVGGGAGARGGAGEPAAGPVDLGGGVLEADALHGVEALVPPAAAPVGAARPGEVRAVVGRRGRIVGGVDDRLDAAAAFERPLVQRAG